MVPIYPVPISRRRTVAVHSKRSEAAQHDPAWASTVTVLERHVSRCSHVCNSDSARATVININTLNSMENILSVPRQVRFEKIFACSVERSRALGVKPPKPGRVTAAGRVIQRQQSWRLLIYSTGIEGVRMRHSNVCMHGVYLRLVLRGPAQNLPRASRLL